MWELDKKKDWVLKDWWLQTVLLEKTLESPFYCKEIKPVNPKGNKSWIFIGRTDAEAPILWPPDAKSWLIWRDADAGKDWRQEEKGMTKDEMVGWHHQRDELEETLGDGEGQWSLAFWVHEVAVSDTTEWLKSNNKQWSINLWQKRQVSTMTMWQSL